MSRSLRVNANRVRAAEPKRPRKANARRLNASPCLPDTAATCGAGPSLIPAALLPPPHGCEPQVLLFSGLMVFAFEVTVSPLLGKRASTPTSMRVVSVVLVLVYPLFPLLTHLRGTGWSLIAASVALLSTILACCDSVGVVWGGSSARLH